MNSIKYICSLGNRCHTAFMLKELKMKKASFPFDWIFSNLPMILHCLEDDFSTLLNKKYYTITDPTYYKQRHSYYEININEYTFNHHNPLNDKDHDYFKRCCKRFKNLLATTELKMFVIMFLNYNKIDEKFINDICIFNEVFGKYTSNYGLLCIIHYVAEYKYYNFIKINNIHFLEIYTPSQSNGKEFEDNEDNIFLHDIITSTYNFDLNDIDPIEDTEPDLNKIKLELVEVEEVSKTIEQLELELDTELNKDCDNKFETEIDISTNFDFDFELIFDSDTENEILENTQELETKNELLIIKELITEMIINIESRSIYQNK